jgi:phage terminase large subunit-like protein
MSKVDDYVLDSLERMPYEKKAALLKVIKQHYERSRYNHLEEYYPDTGHLSIDAYPKHFQFFEAGKKYKFRASIGGNRSGKSIHSHVELVYHLTGLYPHWWPGRKFYKPITSVVGSPSPDNLRRINQRILLGSLRDPGTGLIPKDLLVKGGIIKRPGGGEVFQEIYVKHVSGAQSLVIGKTYKQDVDSYAGDELDFALLDEEVPESIYSEVMTRLMTTNGLSILCFTPLDGLTNVVMKYLPGGTFPDTPNRCGNVKGTKHLWVTNLTWDDAPHLDEKEKESLYEAYLPHERDARTKGIPSIGSGKVWPVDEELFVCNSFKVPDYWLRFFSIDVGAGSTAVTWWAVDPNTGVEYVYDEYKAENRQIFEHVNYINSRGSWIKGVGDPSAQKLRDFNNNQTVLKQYRDLGLPFEMADNAIEPGIRAVYIGLSTGKVKIMSHCTKLLDEMRIYKYGKDGKPAKNQEDHLCDTFRYGVMSGRRVATATPEFEDRFKRKVQRNNSNRDRTTGY